MQDEVLGVSNKILSVLLSQLARLDANSDLLSIGSVFASILGAIFFQQNVKAANGRQRRISPRKRHASAAAEFGRVWPIVQGVRPMRAKFGQMLPHGGQSWPDVGKN